MDWLCLCETHNALQLSVFFFFSVFYQALRNSEQKNCWIRSKKIVLQTIEQLIQYTVLEIQFRSLKYTVVIRIRKYFNIFPFLSKRQAIEGDLLCVDVNNPLWTVFKRVYIAYTYSNFMINQLLYCWPMI